jgi:hypothetical protein
MCALTGKTTCSSGASTYPMIRKLPAIASSMIQQQCTKQVGSNSMIQQQCQHIRHNQKATCKHHQAFTKHSTMQAIYVASWTAGVSTPLFSSVADNHPGKIQFQLASTAKLTSIDCVRNRLWFNDASLSCTGWLGTHRRWPGSGPPLLLLENM